jgi:hypothetical protein
VCVCVHVCCVFVFVLQATSLSFYVLTTCEPESVRLRVGCAQCCTLFEHAYVFGCGQGGD